MRRAVDSCDRIREGRSKISQQDLHGLIGLCNNTRGVNGTGPAGNRPNVLEAGAWWLTSSWTSEGGTSVSIGDGAQTR